MSEQGKDGLSVPLHFGEGGIRLHPKMMQVVESRKVWAGVIGLVITLTLWGFGEISGARAVEALTWVLGIFIGSVALEDGMTRLFSSLAHAVTTQETQGAAMNGSGRGEEAHSEE